VIEEVLYGRHDGGYSRHQKLIYAMITGLKFPEDQAMIYGKK